MNKEFITCLEHIIDLEKTVMVQEDLLLAMNQRADKLGLRNHYERPVLKPAVYVPEPKAGSNSTQWVAMILTFIVVFFVEILICSVIFLDASDAAIFISILILIGPMILLAVWISKSVGKAIENKQNEERRAATLPIKEKENRFAYEKALAVYNASVEADVRRVNTELVVKSDLVQSINDLQAQIQETYDALTAFYDAAGIYELYRNIVAVSYFHEYLASGICTELGGPNGAYITFKNEMYNRMKIERLDTIINYLDQLHYDNTMLRGAIEYAGYCLDDVCRKMDAMIGQQKIAIEQGQTIQQQNALSLYNQECQKQRLDYLAWMEYYNTHLK